MLKYEIKYFVADHFISGTSQTFSQIAQKRRMQKKSDTLLKAKIADTSLYQKGVIKTSPINHTPAENMVAPKNNTDLKMPPKRENIASVGSSNMQAGKAMASLFDIFITIETGSYAGSGTCHWMVIIKIAIHIGRVASLTKMKNRLPISMIIVTMMNT